MFLLCFSHVLSTTNIDQVIKHPVDSSFLVRSIVLLTMKYPDVIESECPMVYIWLHDNSIPFVSAVFDELEVKSIYQDSLFSMHLTSPLCSFIEPCFLYRPLLCCNGVLVVQVEL